MLLAMYDPDHRTELSDFANWSCLKRTFSGLARAVKPSDLKVPEEMSQNS